MLDKLQNMARSFRSLSPALLVLAVLALAYGIYVLLSSNSQADDMALIPSLILFTWATLAHAFLSLFAYVPPRATKEMRFVMKVKVGLRRIPYYCLLVLFVTATGFLLLTSWQLSGAWRMMY